MDNPTVFKIITGIILFLVSTQVFAGSSRSEADLFLAQFPSSNLSGIKGRLAQGGVDFGVPNVVGFQVNDASRRYQVQVNRQTNPPQASHLASGGGSGTGTGTGGGQGNPIADFATFVRCVFGSFYVHQFNIANPDGLEGQIPPALLNDPLCPLDPERYLNQAERFAHAFFGF